MGYTPPPRPASNRVTGRFQLDVFGEALLLSAAAQWADWLLAEAVRAGAPRAGTSPRRASGRPTTGAARTPG
ncbi:hypothetical protein [Streptosporangium sp. NPDC087985]|uniref:hypothetical protein n=1 Tax=Streptosporangium sp. NPDC087985 TaxID=3366196 RepID=UPI003800A26A